MQHFGTQMNQSTFTMVPEGQSKIFQSSKQNRLVETTVNPQQRLSVLQASNINMQPSNNQLSARITKTNPNSTHHYLVSRYGNKLEGQSFDIDQMVSQISEVFCIVCEQYVSESKINQHCKYCQAQPQSEVEQIGKVQERLEKCNYLITRMKKMLKLYCTDKQQVIQYLQLLWKCVSEVIVATNQGALQQVEDLNLFIEFFSELQGENEQIEKLYTQILTVVAKIKDFANRKILLLEQNNVQEFLRQSQAESAVKVRTPFQNVLNISSNASRSSSELKLGPISHKELPQTQSNKSVDKFHPTQEQQFRAHHIFAGADQSFKKNMSAVAEEDSLYSSVQQGQNDILQKFGASKNTSIPNNQFKNSTNNDQKSEFFKLATEMKRQYPNDHPVQTIFVVGLYQKAVQQGVKDYEHFIQQEYKKL